MKLMDWLYFAAVKINTSDINYSPTTTDGDIVKNVLNAAYFWAGIIAVVVIVIAGFMYTLSQDDPAKVARAKNAILYALIGLVVVFAAFGITNFVIGAI